MTNRRSRPVAGMSLGARVLASSVLFCACQGPESGGNVEAGGAAEAVVDPDAPGVRRTGPDQYEAVIFAFDGGFQPSEVRVPVGAEVTFRVRSADLMHGFTVEGTDVELETRLSEFMEASHTFTEAGEYLFLCYLYCSGGHDSMRGVVIVE